VEIIAKDLLKIDQAAKAIKDRAVKVFLLQSSSHFEFR
jgi:hypothetical protein